MTQTSRERTGREQTNQGQTGRKQVGGAPLGVALLTLVLGGCLGAREDTRRHFTLALRAPSAGPTAWRGVLRVQDLEVPREQDRQELLLRRSDVELAYPGDRLWAERPRHLVTDLLLRHLQRTHLFTGVRGVVVDPPPTWVLGGRLDALELVVDDKRWLAHLGLSLELRRTDSAEVLWTWAFDGRRPASAPNCVAGARALSALLNRALAGATASLRKAARASRTD